MDTIIGLAFGKGKINRFLAERIKEIAETDPQNQVIVQDDIYEAGKDILFPVKIISKIGGYLDTIEVLKQVKAFMGISGGDKAMIVCHRLHYKRAIKIAQKIGLKVMRLDLTETPLDRNDPQKHCRNWLIYKLWEIPAWIKYWLE